MEPYSGQTPDPGDLSFCGVQINNAVATLNLLDSIQEILTEVITQKESIYDSQASGLHNALDYNKEIVPNEKWQSAQQIVNYFRIKMAMREIISEEGLDSIRSIAAMCLGEGGMAVYQAIHLLPVCEWDNYPNPQVVECDEEFYKINTVEKEKNFVVLIDPIPASGVMNVRLSESKSGFFEILQSSGQSLLKRKLIDELYFSIDTSEFPSGTYFWTVTTLQGDVEFGKLVILN